MTQSIANVALVAASTATTRRSANQPLPVAMASATPAAMVERPSPTIEIVRTGMNWPMYWARCVPCHTQRRYRTKHGTVVTTVATTLAQLAVSASVQPVRRADQPHEGGRRPSTMVYLANLAPRRSDLMTESLRPVAGHTVRNAWRRRSAAALAHRGRRAPAEFSLGGATRGDQRACRNKRSERRRDTTAKSTE